MNDRERHLNLKRRQRDLTLAKQPGDGRGKITDIVTISERPASSDVVAQDECHRTATTDDK